MDLTCESAVSLSYVRDVLMLCARSEACITSGIEPMHQYRLRQLALVTDDLDKITGQLSQIFGLRVGFRDPSVAEFGLINALFPVGGDFLEVLQPVTDDASARRFRQRRGGDAGYMVILQTDEALQHRERLEAMGVRRIYTLERHGYLTTQFHPREFGGILVLLFLPLLHSFLPLTIPSATAATTARKSPASPRGSAAGSPTTRG